MDREYKEFTTPVAKLQVKIKAWLTGREKREIQSVFLNDTNFKSGTYEISGEKLTLAQDKAIQTIVVSVDGKTEDILNAVLEMHADDFDFLTKEIDKINNPQAQAEEVKK